MKILALIFTIIVMSSCDKSSSGDTELNNINVRLNIPMFINATDNNETISKEIDIYLFSQGIFTKRYENIALSDEHTLSLGVDTKTESKIFCLLDPAKMADLDYLVLNETTEVDFLKTITKKRVDNEEVQPFFIGSTNLSVASVTNPTPRIEMERGVARLDISAREYTGSITIESISLKDINLISYVHTQDPVLYPEHNVGSIEKQFQPALTSISNEGIYYLLEQENSNSELEIRVIVEGLEGTIRAKLPSQIKRNMIYDIEVGVGATLTATIKEREWEVGDNFDADQEVPFKSTINPALSDIPSFIRLSSTHDTLYIPQCNETFNITLSTSAEAEVSVDGKGVSLSTSSSGNNHSYDITVNTKDSDAPKSIVFLNIKDIVNYYGDKIVLVLEGKKVGIYNDVEMDKSLFAEIDPLPGDCVPGAYGGGYNILRIWDNGFWHENTWHSNEGDMGKYITFDLGVEVKLSRFKMYQRYHQTSTWMYDFNNLEYYDVYGATEITDEMRRTGDIKLWELIHRAKSHRPSGLAHPAPPTAEDIVYALAGDDQLVSADAPSLRYIRIHCISSWGKTTTAQILEMTFWKNDVNYQ